MSLCLNKFLIFHEISLWIFGGCPISIIGARVPAAPPHRVYAYVCMRTVNDFCQVVNTIGHISSLRDRSSYFVEVHGWGHRCCQVDHIGRTLATTTQLHSQNYRIISSVRYSRYLQRFMNSRLTLFSYNNPRVRSRRLVNGTRNSVIKRIIALYIMPLTVL